MEENREPLSAIAIEKKLQLLRNKHFSEDLLDTTPKEKKESSFWMKCVAICLLCSYGIAQFLGRVLGDKQAIVQYGLAGIIVICALAFYIWLRRKYR